MGDRKTEKGCRRVFIFNRHLMFLLFTMATKYSALLRGVVRGRVSVRVRSTETETGENTQ